MAEANPGSGPDPGASAPAVGKGERLKERRKARESFRETVVKCSLAGRLVGEHKAQLQVAVGALVKDVSHATHRASLIFNRMLAHCLEHGEQLPPLKGLEAQNTYIHCFTVGNERRATEFTPQVASTYASYFKPLEWPLPARVAGDNQAYIYAAKQYQTVFSNACIFAFEGRQRAHVRAWCTMRDLGKGAVHALTCAINGWATATIGPAHPDAFAFITQERAALGIASNEVNSERWREEHLDRVVRYYHHILVRAAAAATAATAAAAAAAATVPASSSSPGFVQRGFTLAPVCHIKRHFVTLDKKVLEALLKAAQYPATDDVWSALDFRGLRSKPRGGIVQTDGVSLCVHYHIPCAAAAPNKRGAKVPAPAVTPLLPGQRVVAFDPGRCSPLFGVERKADGTVVTHKLSGASYYHGMGKPQADARRARWNKPVAAAHAALTDASPKGVSDGQWGAYLTTVRTHFDALWDNRLDKKWAREAFRAYQLKARTIDRFLRRVQGSVSATSTVPVRIAYGGAKFNASGRGEQVSAPLTVQLKRCRALFGHKNVTLVDEYCTTKCCAKCGAAGRTSVLQNLTIKDATGDVVTVRGLKRCGSTECCSFYDRDRNAALNILQAFRAAASGKERPTHLARDNPGNEECAARFALGCRPRSRGVPSSG